VHIRNLEQLRAIVQQATTQFPKKSLPLRELKPAAVLAPFFLKKDEIHLLFTRRSQSMRNHKGEISFPGGAQDLTDQDFIQTALRETEEEIGVKADDVEIIGELNHWITYTKFRITPIVGIIPYPYAFRISSYEIDEIIEIPLSHLIKPANRRVVYRSSPINPDQQIKLHYFDYQQHTVWGMTGLILSELLGKMESVAPDFLS